ncbi:MAG TPA: VWA domain-containing protein [Candidatus Sulfotelmatobacter sp.]|nr:VWA domain-containing protein [Candidatus Sulfotelmatobacter sp.]
MKVALRILSVVILGVVTAISPLAQQAPVPAQAPSTNPTETLKVETKIVLVDTVVTDKKGNYIHDLAGNDFKVWEDGKEQAVTSFSRESDSADPARGAKHYMVLFFDNSTMDFGDQAKARDAAAKFIDANVGPNHLIAIAEFGGTLRIAQNFTSDGDRLKKVVAGAKFSTVNPNAPSPDLASTGMPPSQPQMIDPIGFGGLEADFGARSVFFALRKLAKGLAAAPGRKTLVFLSSGFVMTMELESELNAVIDACNKANVAVYPVDVRGLVAPTMSPSHSRKRAPDTFDSARFVPAKLVYYGTSSLALLRMASMSAQPAWDPQRPGGGGGGGGGGGRPGGGPGGGAGGGAGGGTGGGKGGSGAGSGGSGGGKGGSGGSGGGKGGSGTTGTTGTGGGRGGSGVVAPTYYGPMNPPRPLVPAIPDNVSATQQFLYQLAEGTGGFVIVNTNDLLGGLERIAKDQSEYYLLGYRPPDSPEGSCHTLKVKVNRGGTQVRFRSGYCKVRPQDLLAGSTTEKDLEKRAAGELPANVSAAVRTPYFYSSPNVAKVHLIMEIPSNTLHFEKVKGKQHAEVNILGIAYKGENAVAARFSDTVNLDFDGKKEVEQFQKAPFHYEKQFDIAAGSYNLRIAFNSGSETFGKIDAPLNVLPYDGKKIAESAIALSNNLVKVTDLDSAYDSEILQDNTPLVVRGLQVFPSATNHFKKTDTAAVYIEVYDPLLTTDKPPRIGLEYRIVNTKSGQQEIDIGFTDTKELITPGNPMVPIGLKLPLERLAPGSYRVDLRAEDSFGNKTDFHTAEFEVD